MTDFEKWIRDKRTFSGLTDAEVKLMQARPVNPKTATKLIGVKDDRAGIWFPTFDVDGNVIPNHGTVRYFDSQPSTVLGESIDGGPKYRLPKDSVVRVSFTPRIGNAKTWREIIADPDEIIVIVEGQKKSMRLAREGYNVIALFGVTMFSASKTGRKLIDDLAQIKWEGREVIIIFDSDTDANPDVVSAERRLAGILRVFGARVAIVCLTPTKKREKRGVDDFLEQEGADALAELIADASSGKYRDLLQNHAIIVAPPSIIEIAADNVVPSGVFRQLLAPQFNERIPGANGTATVIKNFELWLEDERRKRYEKLDFVPGGEYPDVDVAGVGLCRNTWRGWPVKPEPGDYKPWLAVHDRLYVDKAAWMRTYSLDWYSHLVQYPGEKCNVAQVITGESGIGKDMVPEFLGVALNRHFKQIDASDLKSAFTEYLEDALLVDAMEASAPDRRADADFFKNLITRKTNTVNIKYGGKYQQTNHMRLVLTSNHPDPVFATDDERRFFAVNSVAKLMEKNEIARVLRWRDKENGPAHLLYYLLNRKISDAFNATSPAPKTDDFYQIVAAGRSELETFVAELLEDPYGRLVDPYSHLKATDGAPERDIYSLNELLSFLKSTHIYSPTALGKALLKSRKIARPGDGLKRVKGKKQSYQVQLKDRKSPALWAIANVEYWQKASDKEWAHEYERGVSFAKDRVEKLYPPKTWKKAA